MVDSAEVAAELGRLQRNRGLQDAHLGSRVGPQLARLTGFSPERGAEGRESLVRQLLHATRGLAADLRMIFLRACAIKPDDAPTLHQRLEPAAERIDRSIRVVRRRLEAANIEVAKALIEAAEGDRGWFLGELRVTCDLTAAEPVFTADHALVVTAPRLSSVTDWITLPEGPAQDEPRFQASGHAHLASMRLQEPRTWEFTLDLDRTYACGDIVRYQTVMVVPLLEASASVAMMARRDCWRYSATALLAGRASAAWVLDGVTYHTAVADEPTGRRIDLTAEPSPTVEFRNLVPGLVYGIKWLWV